MPLLFAVLLLLVTSTSDAQMYKWVDAKGNTTFSDRPPEGPQAETSRIKVESYNVISFERAPAGNPGQAGDTAVTLYGTSWCTYCKKARSYFQSRGIAYTDLDIERSETAKAQYQRLGARGVPVILVGGARMNGFSVEGFEQLYRK